MVKKGDVLAEVDVPELFKSRDQAQAALGQAQAKVKLAEANVLTVEADRQTAAAGGQFRPRPRSPSSPRPGTIAGRSATESPNWSGARPWSRDARREEKQFDAAVDAERTGAAAVVTAKANLAAAEARVAQARAEVEQADADVAAAEADLAKAEVFVELHADHFSLRRRHHAA